MDPMSSTIRAGVDEAVRRALEIDHRTVWLEGRTDEGDKILIFCTWAPQTVERAKEALQAAGVLCSTELGSLAP